MIRSAAAALLMLAVAPAIAMPEPAVESPAQAPAPATAAQAQGQPGQVPVGGPGATPASVADAAAAGEALPPAWAAALREEAKAVLAGEEFHQRKTSHDLVPRDWLRRLLDFDLPASPRSSSLPDFALLADVVKLLLVVLLALAVAWLLWRGRAWLGPMVHTRRPEGGRDILAPHSLALPDAPLPGGISAAAREAWQAGDAVLALSLLYRGAVRGLEQQHRITLPASATEGECLRQARASGKAVVGAGFAPIVQAWMALAYARRPPADFEQLLTLYIRHFEPRANAEVVS